MTKHNLLRRLACGVLVCGLGLLTSLALAENAVRVGSGTADNGAVASIPLEISADKDVQGFVIVFEWDCFKATGVDLVPAVGEGTSQHAELVVKRVECDYMILSCVVDVDGQGGEKIPAGQRVKVGTAKIRCSGPDSGSRDIDLVLVDNKYARVDGGPLLSNILVIEGKSIGKAEGLKMYNGTLTCKAGGEPPTGEVVFACGGPLGEDGNPTWPKGARESVHPVTFYYKAPGDGAGNTNKIQGLSMAVKYHCNLTAIAQSMDLTGGALAQTNAEFVHLEVDNLGADDPCEFTLGVLVDAVAPFDGRTLPPTTTYKKLISLDFEIENDAACDSCLWLRYSDEVNGNGDVYVNNLVSINFYPVKPKLVHCDVCVNKGKTRFVRGDCNFDHFSAQRKFAVDISDAAAMVGHMFLSGAAHFEAPCLDACDANDDGRLDAADVVFILNYLFVPKSPWPPAPGPLGAGFDPTDDNLDCKAATPQC